MGLHNYYNFCFTVDSLYLFTLKYSCRGVNTIVPLSLLFLEWFQKIVDCCPEFASGQYSIFIKKS